MTLLTSVFVSGSLFAQQLDILIIGSTKSFSDGNESGVVKEKAFNPTTIASRLQSILSQDPAISESVNVEFEDIFKTNAQVVNTSGSTTANLTHHCYSLAQHFMWTDNRATRLANLRGEGDHVWDYIILFSDPYIMANFPGMYAEGVKLIQSEIAKSSNPARLVLVAQWPEGGATASSVNIFNEVVHRVGQSSGLTVVPAGKAWNSYSSKDNSTAHPTPRGEYLAASAIYSKLFGRSASTSAYNYTNPQATGDAIADHAHAVVQATDSSAQFSGFFSTINAFSMKYERQRSVTFRETGSSTEDGIRSGLSRVDDHAGITLVANSSAVTFWDFNYGRGPDWWEDDKDYEVDPTKYGRSYGFPMHYYNTQSAPITMAYGIDKAYENGSSYRDITDLGIAYNMVRPGTRETGLPEGHDVRCVPIRLMWLKMREVVPNFNPLGDNSHMGRHLNDATAAFMFTLITGRCPVIDEPEIRGSTDWMEWLAHKIGYETAWQMAHLTTRAPGFKIMPSAATKLSIEDGTTETMEVRFMYPPQSEVTVTVGCSNDSAAIVGPKTLTFTPSNYNVPQQITVAGIPGKTASVDFNVTFSTSSNDHIYDGLSDSWAYSTTRLSTVNVNQTDKGVISLSTVQNEPLPINLGAAGSNSSNTILIGPYHGGVTWTGDGMLEYTPDLDYTGNDFIVYAATVGTNQTIGCIEIVVEIPEGQMNVASSDAVASETGPDIATFTLTRIAENISSPVNVFFSMGGTAILGNDYTLSHGSPVTIPGGQDSVTITLTPIDDRVFGERDETAVLTITPNAAYPIGTQSALVIISDNDNNAPSANAGDNWTLYMTQGSESSPDPVAGADIFLDAGLDSGSNNVWEDSMGVWNLSLDTLGGVAYVASPVTNRPGITGAYHFPGGLSGAGGATGSSFKTLVWNNSSVSMEIWFKPDSTQDDGQTNGQILFETGGSTGLGIFYNDGAIQIGLDSTQVINSVDVSSLASDFIQVVLTYDVTGTDNFELYINGKPAASGNRADTDWSGTDDAGLGARGAGNVGGRGNGDANTESFEGQIAIFRAYTGQILTPAQVKTNYDSVATGGVLTTLSGSGDDLEGDPLTYQWSVLSQPDGSTVRFGDGAAADSTARFDRFGTYVLKLTVDDGLAQGASQMTIEVKPMPSKYAAWAGGSFSNEFSIIDPNYNVDGDGKGNMMEFAFGTDPTANDDGSLLVNGSVHGDPVVVKGAGGAMEFYFVRRDDHGTSGSVRYIVQFSGDLTGFTNSTATPQFVVNSGVNAAYEVVKVPYPTGARFGRVRVEFAP